MGAAVLGGTVWEGNVGGSVGGEAWREAQGWREVSRDLHEGATLSVRCGNGGGLAEIELLLWRVVRGEVKRSRVRSEE